MKTLISVILICAGSMALANDIDAWNQHFVSYTLKFLANRGVADAQCYGYNNDYLGNASSGSFQRYINICVGHFADGSECDIGPDGDKKGRNISARCFKGPAQTASSETVLGYSHVYTPAELKQNAEHEWEFRCIKYEDIREGSCTRGEKHKGCIFNSNAPLQGDVPECSCPVNVCK